VNYTWHITKLGLSDQLNQEGKLLENAIVSVQWKCVAQDTDGTSSSYVSSSTLDASHLSLEQFIAVNSVTSEQVIAWVKSTLSAAEQIRINKQLETKVERNRVRNIKPSW
tara:strand:+ start:482 stop:811 length:330 start_codon:yes stop_codon:yes gene_type:complete